MDYSKTTHFILPVLNFTGSFQDLKRDGFVNSYLGWSKHLNDVYGRYLYVVFDNYSISDKRIQEIEQHDKFIDRIILDNVSVYLFSLDESFQRSVIDPFLKGKYSMIDRGFVEDKHPMYSSNSMDPYHKNKARLVLDKSDEIRDEWEDRLATRLPENAEVWSIPCKETEVLDYLLP